MFLFITVIIFFCGVVAIVLGIRGFTKQGFPLAYKKNITGFAGKLLGVSCIIFGVTLIAFLIILWTGHMPEVISLVIPL